MEVVLDMNIPKLRGKVFLFINTVTSVNGIFHHRGTRLRKGYGAAGAFTEGFSFFAHREIRRRMPVEDGPLWRDKRRWAKRTLLCEAVIRTKCRS